MGDLIKSVVRTGVQLGWGSVVAWLVVRHIDVPDAVTAWVTDAAVGVVMLGVTAAIRFMETRSSSTGAGKVLRWVAKVVMLGASWRPKYTPATAGASGLKAHRA